jgi:hypothetical protein
MWIKLKYDSCYIDSYNLLQKILEITYGGIQNKISWLAQIKTEEEDEKCENF